jgi:hypothetical protein
LKRPYWHGRDLFSPEVPGQPEEVLIADARAGLTPADMVERKLLFLLRGASVAGSHLCMGGPSVRGKVESTVPRRGRMNGGASVTGDRKPASQAL